MAANPAKIMLVDDHAIVREGYRSLLQKQPGWQVVAEAADGMEAYRLFKQADPDLVIMDLSLPGLGGVEAIKRIRQWQPAARILVLSMHQNAAYALQAMRAGAKGYVTKSSAPETLLKAVSELLKGRSFLSEDIAHELALGRLAEEPRAIDALTPREFEILRMLLAEKTGEEIAETLHVSPKTVANRRTLIKGKLGVASDIELVRLAARQGILAEDDEPDETSGGRKC